MPVTPTEERPPGAGDAAGAEGWLAGLSPARLLVLVALVATVIGAAVGTATTLLVGDPGPRGERGARGPAGERGPAGPQGPPGDTSAAEAAVADLDAEVDDLAARVEDLEAGGLAGEDELADLEGRVADIESFVSELCFELDLDC